MNKNGFTLVELLAVIAMLAVISTIAGFSYIKIMKDNKEKQSEQKILYIEKQAVKYASENPSIFNGSSTLCKDVTDLVNSGYLDASAEESDILNPLTNSNFDEQIKISKINGLISAEYGGSCE